MRRCGRRRAPPPTARAGDAHPLGTAALRPAFTRGRRAHSDAPRRPVRQAHQQAELPADRPIALYSKRSPRQRMLRRDDHHLGRQRSAQLT